MKLFQVSLWGVLLDIICFSALYYFTKDGAWLAIGVLSGVGLWITALIAKDDRDADEINRLRARITRLEEGKRKK